MRVDVGKRTEELVNVELDFQHGHGGLHLVEVPGCSVNGFWDIFENEVQVHFIFLQSKEVNLGPTSEAGKQPVNTYPLTVRVVKRLELYDIGVADDPHDLQFTVLGEVSVTRERGREGGWGGGSVGRTLKRLS